MSTILQRAHELASQIPADRSTKALDPQSAAAASEIKNLIQEQGQKLSRRMDSLEAHYQRPGGQSSQGSEYKSIGERITESDTFKASLQQKGLASKHGELLREFVGQLWIQGKTAITSGNVGADVIQPQTRPGIIPLAVQPLRIRDLMVALPASSPSVLYVKENSFTNSASPQVEAQAKAESALDFDVLTATARTIAHWIPATNQVLDDMSGLRSYIDGRLMYGLKLKEEIEILSGDGTGQHLHGIIPQATGYNAALNVPGDTKVDRIRRVLLQLELADEVADAIVLNPVDYTNMETLKDAEERYILAAPGAAISFRTLWNKPVVSSKAITSGYFLVGAFGTGAHIHDRMDATIDISTEHSDYFTRNMVAIRCEERLALTVERPGAFVYGAF